MLTGPGGASQAAGATRANFWAMRCARRIVFFMTTMTADKPIGTEMNQSKFIVYRLFRPLPSSPPVAADITPAAHAPPGHTHAPGRRKPQTNTEASPLTMLRNAIAASALLLAGGPATAAAAGPPGWGPANTYGGKYKPGWNGLAKKPVRSSV